MLTSPTNIIRLPRALRRLLAVACLASGCSPFQYGLRDLALQSDHDGEGTVPPDDDRCPTEPEVKNGWMDEDGCPDEIPKKIAKFKGTIKGIYFDLDKATIKPKSRPVLDRAAAIMTEFSTLDIGIVCYETSIMYGGRAAARLLTAARARAIKTYLVERGVAQERIGIRGMGAVKPADAKPTRKRDCEFTITHEKRVDPYRRYSGPLSVDFRSGN